MRCLHAHVGMCGEGGGLYTHRRVWKGNAIKHKCCSRIPDPILETLHKDIHGSRTAVFCLS